MRPRQKQASTLRVKAVTDEDAQLDTLYLSNNNIITITMIMIIKNNNKNKIIKC